MTLALVSDELDWQRDAACRELDWRLFFPEYEWLVDERVLSACRVCPVREVCLTYALEHFEQGIWGGLTEEQRNAVNKNAHRVRCPDCRSDNVASDGSTEVCVSCGLSWQV